MKFWPREADLGGEGRAVFVRGVLVAVAAVAGAAA